MSNVLLDTTSNQVLFDVTASEGELWACYFVESPDDPYVGEATTVTWVDTAGVGHTAVDWDWTDDYTKTTGTIVAYLEPDAGVTPAAVTGVHAECRIRVFAGYDKKRRSRVIVKNGTQTASRSWSPYLTGGNCNYKGYRGDLLVTCLFAKSTVTYKMRSQHRIVRSGVGMHPGLYPCRTTAHRDLSNGGHAIRFTVVTSNPDGFAQCWLTGAAIKIVYYVRVKDYDKVDVETTWTNTSPTPSPSTSPTESPTVSPTATASPTASAVVDGFRGTRSLQSVDVRVHLDRSTSVWQSLIRCGGLAQQERGAIQSLTLGG